MKLSVPFCLTFVVAAAAGSFAHSAEENPAEKLFGEMISKLNEAKTATFVVESVVKDQFTLKANAKLKVGNKAHITITMRRAGAEDGTPMLLVSDGTTQVTKAGDRRQPEQPTPPTLVADILGSIFHTGFMPAFTLSRRSSGDAASQPKLIDMIEVSEFQLGKREQINKRAAQAVTYQITSEQRQFNFKTTVWIDVKTKLPLKREIRLKQFSAVETYTQLKTNVKFDEKLFDTAAVE
jgi:outer membrane lipoprotein-sorting protein